MFLTNVFRWIFAHEPVWLQKFNEEIAGLLGSALVFLPGVTGVGAFFLFTAASLVYEAFIDPNGWNKGDVAEREAAFFGGLIVLTIAGVI